MARNVHVLELAVRPWMSQEHVSKVSDVSAAALKFIEEGNYQYLLLTGTWTLGRFGHSLDLAKHRKGAFKEALPGANAADIIGNPYAPLIPYKMSPEIGGTRALNQLRSKLTPIGVILDFVVNHTARDASWTIDHPEYYIYDKKLTLACGASEQVKWEDTAQLNLWMPNVREVLISQAVAVAAQCDGMRCHMAHLSLNNNFGKKWRPYLLGNKYKRPDTEFWEECIATVKSKFPDFVFIAENTSSVNDQIFIQLGFDYTDNSSWANTLLSGHLDNIRCTIFSQSFKSLQTTCFKIYQDSNLPVTAQYGSVMRTRCAASLSFMLPGLHMHQMGQHDAITHPFDNRLRRRVLTPHDMSTREFYKQIQTILKHRVFTHGSWEYLPPKGEESSWRLIAWRWQFRSEKRLCVFNFSDDYATGHILLTNAEPDNGQDTIPIFELLSNQTFLRQASTLRNSGLCVVLDPWQIQIFKY